MPASIIKIACSTCRRVTYWRTASQRKKGVERKKLETKKFCRFCRAHTPHQEKK